MSKKKAEAVTGEDLKFVHKELAQKLAITILQEMDDQKLTAKDIPQVLHDIVKFIVLAEAEAGKENALFIVQRMIELDRDLTTLMMRIVENQMLKQFIGKKDS